MQPAMTAKARRLLFTIALLAVVGVAVSSVSLYHHFGTEKSSYCDFGQKFNCDMVNRSIYSTLMGIPVALIGVLGYLLLLGLATAYRAKTETPAMLLAASLAGLGFALYLTYLEAFVLAVWCVLCLSSLAVIVATTGLAGILVWESNPPRKP
jgi:vitamin-K-epoxide reductase (warfarin-sensitive)